MYIYGSYRKIKTGVPLFWNTLYSAVCSEAQMAGHGRKLNLEKVDDLVVICEIDH